MSTPPRWDLTNIFPALESKEFTAAFGQLKTKIADLGDYFDEVVTKADANQNPQQKAILFYTNRLSLIGLNPT